MESQLFDRFLEESLSVEPYRSEATNTTPDLLPNYMWSNQYNPLAYDFDILQSLDDLESGFNLSNSSGTSEFYLPSPISDSSSINEEDRFDQKPLINPWGILAAFENNTITPAAPCNSPSEESFPAIAIPSLDSPSGSSEPTSPQNVVRDMRTKRPTKWAQKQRPKNSGAKSSCSKGPNAHNLIEKRYRNNLNSKIKALRNCIPSLRSTMKENEEGEDGLESDSSGSRRVQKCNKGIILDKAIEYIVELERKVESRSRENAGLQLMIKGNIPSYPMLGLRC